jgi:magnesium-dependent phosphatase 1
MALASRTGAPAWARQILDYIGLRGRFAHEQIYPGSKERHFHCLRKESGLPFDRMVFLDDEMRNIDTVKALGVHTIHVPEGLNWDHFQCALTCLGEE